MDRLVNAFVAAHMCGFHDLDEKPAWGDRHKMPEYLRAMRAFQAAIQRGIVPPPDKKRSTGKNSLNLWRLSTLKKHVAGKGAANA